MKDFKNTLLLGETSFEMRGNLGVKEPQIEKKWEDLDLYNLILKQNEGKKEYTLHDGPPYANGDIHLGHALNKILKDFIVRYHNMAGYKSVYIPGWDTHGLPIETALQKKGINRKTMPVAEFRELCYEYALEQVNRQKVGFKRLGVLGDFDNPYITLQHDFERDQLLVFAKMVEKGLIYKGMKPVYWSWSSESALAEAEIEYHDKKDTSIYFTFDIVNGLDELKDAKLLVWTTTPWTLPGNLAVCAGADIEYILCETNYGKLLFGTELKDKLTSLLNLGEVKVLKNYKGSDLTNLKYKHFLNDRVSPVINGDHVTTTDGTGLVHTAPGLGEDDYNVGKLYNLGMITPVDSKGIMNKEALKYEGMFYEDCSKQIIADMGEMGVLIKALDIVHSYPHDWRTKKPIIFRATPQWFASIDPIKEDVLKAIHDVKWTPAWGDLRMTNMIKDRHDWCISRQRAWGVPIPIFYAENDTPILDPVVIRHVAEIVNEKGSNAWFTMTEKELLPAGYSNPNSPNGVFRKEHDIMDVWFDSGSSYMLLQRRGLSYPCDLYLEGSDQYRGWFNSSLITGVATQGCAPYKNVLSHGFTLDGEGRKMSKSLGNVVDPIKVCNEMGADILRLWVSSVEYQSDFSISKDIIKQVSESYRKIRNTLKFMLANTSDFNPKDSLDFDDLLDVDKYMIIKYNEYLNGVINAYETYNFGEVFRKTNQYISNTLSAFYLDFTKDILYIETKTSKTRLSTQTAFYQILLGMMKVLTPILPHTMSEAYDTLKYKEKCDIALCMIPEVKSYEKYDSLKNSFDSFMNYRDCVLKALEDARNEKIITKSFGAHIVLTLDKEAKKVFDSINANFSQLLIVSKLEFVDGDTFKVEVKKCEGVICERCRMVVDNVNEDSLCERCAKIVKTYEE